MPKRILISKPNYEPGDYIVLYSTNREEDESPKIYPIVLTEGNIKHLPVAENPEKLTQFVAGLVNAYMSNIDVSRTPFKDVLNMGTEIENSSDQCLFPEE